jgi:hypothetical protein
MYPGKASVVESTGLETMMMNFHFAKERTAMRF